MILAQGQGRLILVMGALVIRERLSQLFFCNEMIRNSLACSRKKEVLTARPANSS